MQQNKKAFRPNQQTKEKDPGKFQFKIKRSIDNIIGWNERYLFMEEKIEEKNYE